MAYWILPGLLFLVVAFTAVFGYLNWRDPIEQPWKREKRSTRGKLRG
jgi:hypothetical protein